jgi:dUTP pyrophosphatase
MSNNQGWEEIQKKFQQLVDESNIDFYNDLGDLDGLLDGDLSEITEQMDRLYKTKKIYTEKINPDAITPQYVYPTDSGFDLYSTEDIEIESLGRYAVPTGLKVSFDEGYELQVRPKSGLALNSGLTVLNTPGTVDQGYTGEIKVILFNTSRNSVSIKKGTKVAQGVLCPVVNGKYVVFEEVEKLDPKDRGDNGFGSTGLS